MKINAVELSHFRNYQNEKFVLHDHMNVIYGDNAQGKTNLMESIYLLSAAKSFRTFHKRELIAFGQNECSVCADIISHDRAFELQAKLSQISPASFFINHIKCKRNYELNGILNTVLFCPDDLDIVRGSASDRRRFIDNALSQLRPAYADALAKYQKLLENKNKILKLGPEKPSMYKVLDDFSNGMVNIGSLIIKKRLEFLHFIDKEAQRMHENISNHSELLTIRYHSIQNLSFHTELPEIQACFRQQMDAIQQREILARQSLCGPHRDDFDILINEQNCRSFASQGQSRTAAISLKLAERLIFLKDTGEYPVLLLDDVLSELDQSRQNFILNHIAQGQVLITCCDKEQFDFTDGLFCIKNGRLV